MKHDNPMQPTLAGTPVFRHARAGTVRSLRLFGPLVVALFCLLLALPAWATDVQVHASRNQVSIDESFDLVFEANEALDGDPDFSPLEKQFEILRQYQSQNIQMINNQMRRSVSWTLTLMAKETGDLEIPVIRFGKDLSHPLIVRVHQGAPKTNGNGEREVYLDVQLDPDHPYVQSQMLLTLRLYVSNSLTDVRLRELTEPEIKGVDAVVERLGEDRQFRSQQGTRTYTVLERRYAIFPQQSGTAALEPIRFQGEVGGNVRSFSLFDRRPFGSSSTPRVLREYSERHPIKVAPAPDQARGQSWLPAQQLTLDEAWSGNPDEIELGQPMTRTLALIADGLTAAQLPNLGKQALPEGLKAYPDQPMLKDQTSDAGVIGSRQEKLAIVATQPGDYTLPAIEVSWWNTENDQPQTARIPARKIRVIAPAGLAPDRPAAPSTQPDPQPDEVVAAPPSPVDWVTRYLGIKVELWSVWLSLFLGLGWLLTLLAWWRASRKRLHAAPSRTTAAPAAPDLSQALKQVRASYRNRDPVAAREAILCWGRARWPDNPPPHLTAIAQRCGDSVRDAIDHLNRDCYTPEGGDDWHQLPMDRYLEQAADGLKPVAAGADPAALLPGLLP